LPEELIAIVAILMVFGIPMIAILAHHQRKMAELIHAKRNDVNPAVLDEIQRLKAEVTHLRSQLNEATIALDDVRRLKPTGAIEQRIREGG
jgi:hypothetical protein